MPNTAAPGSTRTKLKFAGNNLSEGLFCQVPVNLLIPYFIKQFSPIAQNIFAIYIPFKSFG
jgi:hypothetical protein